MTEERPFWRSAPALAALGAAVAVIASEAVFSTLSGEPAEFALFLGRFHPLAVHLPIGVVLLVAASEALSFVPRYRPRIDPAIGLVLPALVAVSVGAFFLGELLGRAGEYAPRILNLHRRLELFAVIGVCGCLVAWTYQTRAGTPRARLVYRAALGFTLLVMSTGAHFGGTMTHGETYLLRYAPGPLRSLLGGGGEEKTEKAAKPPASAGAEPTLFAQAVAPILKERCAGCHGPDKVKGGLRLDSLEGIQKGGENGKVVTPGAPNESPLLTNILLPLDDDAHMPPPEKPQPTPPEIAILRFWIERGANDKLLLRDALPPPESRLLLEKALGAPPSPPAPSSKTPTNTTPASAPSAPAPASSPAPSPPDPRPSSPDPSSPDPSSPVPPASSPRRSAQAILSAACESCHGAKKQKAKLRVDSVEALLAGGKRGPAIVPGKPEASELIRRIQLPLSDEKHMPPEEEPQLSAAEIQTLSAWIRGLGSNATAAPPVAARPAKEPSSSSEEPASTTPATPAEGTAQPDASAATPAASEPTTPSPAQAEPQDSVSPEAVANLPVRLVLFPDAVQPMLMDRCGKCHAGQKPAMGLRVDEHAAILKGGLSGPSVVPGKPDESLLVQRVSLPLSDGDHMPPEDEPQITAGEILVLRLWVEQGAAESLEVNTKDLAPEAQRAVASRPPPMRSSAEPPTVAANAGGCAACSVGAGHGLPFGGWVVAAGLFSSLVARRIRRARTGAGSHRSG